MSDPFAGLERKRLPGIHMITARKGGMPLRDALAAYFFMMLHDKVAHECLIKEAFENQKGRTQQAAEKAKSLESTMLTLVFGLMGSSSLLLEEWSYLDEDDVYLFYMIADMAIEQVQRWIAEGSHQPFELPLMGGAIVTRTPWTITEFGTPDDERRKEAREHVKGLFAELGLEIN